MYGLVHCQAGSLYQVNRSIRGPSLMTNQVDVLVAEQTQAAGLTGFIVMPPTLREINPYPI
jgi:hypothetical protein